MNPNSLLQLIVHRRKIAYRDPILLFDRLCRERPGTILLESAEVDSKRHLQSFLLVQPAVRIECLGREVTAVGLTDNGIRVCAAMAARGHGSALVSFDGRAAIWRYPPCETEIDEDQRLLQPSVFEPLRLLRQCFEASPEDQSAFWVGGLFSYDLVENFEPLPTMADHHNCPGYVFFLAEQLIRIDHVNREATATCITFALDSNVHDAVAIDRKLDQMAQLAENESPVDLPEAEPFITVATTDVSDEKFVAIVERLKREIVKGVVFQTVPSRSFSMPCSAPLRAYRRLRKSNPSPYMFYVRDEKFVVFGASPETAVKFTAGDRIVELCPIAGTRRRGLGADGQIDVDFDSRIELELRSDQKEMAEHLMLVDLARNDLARICETGTRYVAQLLKVDRYSHVMHLVSRLRGELRRGLDGLHAYQACMNMGTLTGAPKVQAMQLIRELEGSKRGSYGGAVGYFNGAGDLDSCIVIRSAFITEGVARVQAGAGIVHDSDPLAEANETRGKAEAVLNALRTAHLSESES
jgi:anthranilate synthase component 1